MRAAPTLPVLETQRLWLRPWALDDLDAFHAIWGDPEVIWWGANESLETTRRVFERLVDAPRQWPAGVGWFAICERAGAQGYADAPIVGDVLLQPGKAVPGIEIGWHLRRDVWGQGYATEAASRVLTYAHQALEIDEVSAIVATQNAPSLRVVAKLGMRRGREMVYAELPHVLFHSQRGPSRPSETTSR